MRLCRQKLAKNAKNMWNSWRNNYDSIVLELFKNVFFVRSETKMKDDFCSLKFRFRFR